VKIAIASDHTGVEHRRAVQDALERLGHECIDMGCEPDAERVDYPDFAESASRAVSRGDADTAVCICGTGNGMSIAANKIPGIRAVVCWDEYTTRMGREHNNANVLCMGARCLDIAAAVRLAAFWTQFEFKGGRHEARVEKVMKLEQTK